VKIMTKTKNLILVTFAVIAAVVSGFATAEPEASDSGLAFGVEVNLRIPTKMDTDYDESGQFAEMGRERTRFSEVSTLSGHGT
jgi:hypothetical protein